MALYEGVSKADSLRRGKPNDDLEIIKDIIRWYAATSTGRLDEQVVTTGTVTDFAQRLFGGLQRETGVEHASEDRTEIYSVSI